MSFAAAKEQLSALTPAGRQWIDGENYLDLVEDGQELSLGLGVVGDEDDDKAYLLARVVLYADCFGDAETVDEAMVLELAATALGLPEGLDCQVGIEVYDGSTDESGALVPSKMRVKSRSTPLRSTSPPRSRSTSSTKTSSRS